jgi:hypothetical protein
MSTIHRPVTVEEHSLILSLEVQNIKHVLEMGAVADDEYDQLGYSIDIDKTAGSFFYTAYPNHESTVQVSNVIHQGHFQDLTQYVGLGFERTQEGIVEKLCSPDPSKGIFHWSKSTRHLVERTNFKDSDVFEDKQLHFVGYLTETCHGMFNF